MIQLLDDVAPLAGLGLEKVNHEALVLMTRSYLGIFSIRICRERNTS